MTKQATVQVLDAGASTQVTTMSVGRNLGFPEVPMGRFPKAREAKIPTSRCERKARTGGQRFGRQPLGHSKATNFLLCTLLPLPLKQVSDFGNCTLTVGLEKVKFS